ncbi:hypothetical protein STEG23_012164 [Scotinomys teguina]
MKFAGKWMELENVILSKCYKMLSKLLEENSYHQICPAVNLVSCSDDWPDKNLQSAFFRTTVNFDKFINWLIKCHLQNDSFAMKPKPGSFLVKQTSILQNDILGAIPDGWGRRQTTFYLAGGGNGNRFRETQYPDVLAREELVRALNVPEVKMKMWFVNGRAKERKNEMWFVNGRAEERKNERHAILLQSTPPGVEEFILITDMEEPS